MDLWQDKRWVTFAAVACQACVCVVSHTLPGNKPHPANVLANSDTVFQVTVESSNRVNKPV